MEMEKLAQEKTEMQRHYVMDKLLTCASHSFFFDVCLSLVLQLFWSLVLLPPPFPSIQEEVWGCLENNLCFEMYYEMSYGLNVEMHKQISQGLPKKKRGKFTFTPLWVRISVLTKQSTQQ
uniref:TLE_N domain-containing protein n=1 Tax=Rhodnius prolixus TaxID=13249 RepID=T1IFS7_RHOPR